MQKKYEKDKKTHRTKKQQNISFKLNISHRLNVNGLNISKQKSVDFRFNKKNNVQKKSSSNIRHK